MSDAMIATYAAAIGFVAAGLLGSFYQLVTTEPARFRIDAEGMVRGTLSVVLCMFAGPFILMRNALCGRRIEDRPLAWLVVTALVAGAWSLCSGIVVLEFALALRSTVG